MSTTTEVISGKDLAVLRGLAEQQAAIAALPEMVEKRELWRRLNRLERARPMIMLHNDTWHETGDQIVCVCEGEWARRQEWGMRASLYHREHMKDDSIYDAVCYSPIVTRNATGWGVNIDATRADHVFGACHYNGVLMGDEDPAMIPMPEISIDEVATELAFARNAAIFDGIMPVQKRGNAWTWFAIIDLFIQWRGLQETFTDMVDRPEWIHAWLRRMTDRCLAEFDQLEALNALALNNGAVGHGPGGLGVTDELPAADFDGTHVRTKDMWGHATTQIFSEVSPAMHEEFALQYEKEFLARFGLAGYGCCEPLDRKVDILARNIPHLRRISMSPWVDVARGAEALGSRYVFSYKPNPAIMGMEPWDIDYARAQLREVFEATRGCVIEVIMKDLHTCHGEPRRMWEWVEMATALAEEYAV